MKMKWLIVVILLAVIGFGGMKVYSHLTKEVPVKEEISTPVRVIKVEEVNIAEELVYQGRVAPNTIEKVSFKSSARLESFTGEVGELLAVDTILAVLDTSDLELALDAAQNQLNAASSEYQRAIKGARPEDIELASITVKKANEAVAYLTNQVANVAILYEEGIVSQSEYDGAVLELNLANSDLSLANKNFEKATNGTEIELISAAKAQVGLANTNIDVQNALIEDTTYTINEPRILIEKFYEPGELVPAGYPVAILRSIDQGVVIGVTGKDLDQVYLGQKVTVSNNHKETTGSITRIAEIPDDNHFLYEVEVELNDDSYKVGEIVSCYLQLGKKNVMMIPISAIINDGIDYVFINDGNRASIRKIEIIDVIEGNAIVTGLNVDDQMIVSNLNKIHEQSLITIEE